MKNNRVLDALYQRTGIKLTEYQTHLLKNLLQFLGAFVIGSLVLGACLLIAHAANPGCDIYSSGYSIRDTAKSCIVTTGSAAPLVGLAVFGLLTGLGALVFLLSVMRYVIRVVTDKTFRETEMAQSVSYEETDEREQLITMRATRRAYMVLNFTLLAGWFLSALSRDFGTALLLFIIQLVGTLSYRKEALK